MEPLGVNHVAIKALDVRRTAQFYVDVLGLTETHRNMDERGLRSVWLRCGSTVIMLERSGTAGSPPESFDRDPPGLHLVALTIDAATRPRWIQHFEALGHPVVHETDYTLYVQDPEGNRIGLSSFPTASRTR